MYPSLKTPVIGSELIRLNLTSLHCAWRTGKKKAPRTVLRAGHQKQRSRAGRLYFFVLSTLLPITPPRIAPAAPPMIAPFTLWPATAPITAPAPAPIAASRLVCLTTTGAGAGALYTGAEEYVPPDELLRVVRRTGAR